MKTATVLRYCGISLLGVSLLMLVSAGVALHEKSEEALLPLSYAGIVTAVIGAFPLIFVPRQEMEDACIFILFFLGLTTIGGFVNAAGGMDLRSGLSAAIACMGNVGPGFGSVGSMGNYSALPDALKINSMVLMLLGRLEIYPIFMIFGSYKR